MAQENYNEMRKRHDKELSDLITARQKAYDEIAKNKDAEKEGRGGEFPAESEKQYLAEIADVTQEFNPQIKALEKKHFEEATQNLEEYNQSRAQNQNLEQPKVEFAQEQQNENDAANQNELSEKEKKRQAILEMMKQNHSREKDRGFSR